MARTILVACVVAGACTGDGGQDLSSDAAIRAELQRRLNMDSSAACFVADQSVLARAANAPSGPESQRGWIQLFQFGLRDSSAARLVDSDGSSVEAFWHGLADSIVVQGSNDSVTVQVRLRVRDAAANGSIHARSDAAPGRRAAIGLDYASCDSMPKPGATAS